MLTSTYQAGVAATENFPQRMTEFFSFSTCSFFSNIIFRFLQSMWTIEKIPSRATRKRYWHGLKSGDLGGHSRFRSLFVQN
jgi:hypothetical protein